MLKWIDLFELMGYITAMFSVSVSYVSKVQKEHYSDFLKQNQGLRETFFSPFFSRVIMFLLCLYLIYFIKKVIAGETGYDKSQGFAIAYILFLGVLAACLLYFIDRLSFVGAPMLIMGILMIFFVETAKVYKKT
jgi:hypothetical protein